MSMMISPADTAPTDSSFEYWFDGDLLHGPEHGSLRDGFLEFYPRTHTARGRSMQIQWFSQPSGVWPPEDGSDRAFEIWHDGYSNIGDNQTIDYRPEHPVERFATGSIFQSFGAFRRHIETSSGGQTLNQQALVFWDLSKLPTDARVDRVELIGNPNTSFESTDGFQLTWITRQEAGPEGYPGWINDYHHGRGNAFRGSVSAFMGGFVQTDYGDNRPSLELNGASRVRRMKLLGLHVCFTPGDTLPVGTQHNVNLTMAWEHWVQGWGWYREFGTASDARSALQELPGLRIHFAPHEPDEPLTRHDARQVRARHSTPRQVGRMKT